MVVDTWGPLGLEVSTLQRGCQREEAEMSQEAGVNGQSQEETDTKGIQSTEGESGCMVGRMGGGRSVGRGRWHLTGRGFAGPLGFHPEGGEGQLSVLSQLESGQIYVSQ